MTELPRDLNIASLAKAFTFADPFADLEGLGFKPIGTLAPDDEVVLKPIAGPLMFGRVGDEGPGEHVVECLDCPTTYDAKYGRTCHREWVLKTARAAEVAAEMHQLATGHAVRQTQRFTWTMHATVITPTLWALLFGGLRERDLWLEVALAGDCGDVERSLA